MAIPRFQDGVPVTLGYVTKQTSLDGNPLITPYPNWTYNDANNCASIISVYRIQIDECDRLWVLDTGKLKETQVCPPKLHVFSLRENRLITTHEFPRDQFKEDSLFVTVVVDIRNGDDKCKNTFAYIADVTGFALIVYDFSNSRSWKISNNLFYPYPAYGTFDINGDTFDLMDGILGLALGPVHNGDRILYFHSLASRVESWVPTSIIRNYTLFHENSEAAARSFVAFEDERSSQSAAEAMDRNGVLFFGSISDLAIACWNSKHYPRYGKKNIEIIVRNSETLQFPSGLKVITSKKGRQELWVLTPSFQKYMTGKLHSNETNFRIQAGFVDELIRGTNQGTNPLARDLSNTMKVIYEWKYIDFVPNDGEESSKNYKKFVPIDVDRWRSKIDRCDRLWVLDTGVVDTDHVCPAKLVVFDLRTSRLLKRIEIPKEVAINSTTGLGLLVTPAVQTNCEKTTVYIADVEGHGLIVYNDDDNSFRRLTSSAFDADLRYENYTIEGQTFQLTDGIVGMAVSPVSNLLYFNPMTSHNLEALETKSLGGNEPRYIVRTLQFTSGLKVKNTPEGEELLALTNRFQKAATDTYNIDEVNFRILRGNVEKLEQLQIVIANEGGKKKFSERSDDSLFALQGRKVGRRDSDHAMTRKRRSIRSEVKTRSSTTTRKSWSNLQRSNSYVYVSPTHSFAYNWDDPDLKYHHGCFGRKLPKVNCGKRCFGTQLCKNIELHKRQVKKILAPFD
ncbi:Protein yellow [Melipona quadrifasciata]|uniref:Protein yellow n=1 Tax=Melipona quadrifasciata TaxID=166423 RepID=A0A0M9A6R8_9HYME|nr:Protein yellow [Melipona quadrifasciata]